MKDPIAETHFVGIDANGQEIDILASVGKPFLNAKGVWSCPAKLIGIYGCPDNFYGEDSLQALCLATSFFHTMILSFVRSGGKIKDAEHETEQYVNAIFGRSLEK
jgi:hypothetical protein